MVVEAMWWKLYERFGTNFGNRNGVAETTEKSDSLRRIYAFRKAGWKILDLMSEFEEMDIQKETRQASKIRADMHLRMIQIDETLATTATIHWQPPTANEIVSESGESAKKANMKNLEKKR